MGERQGRNQTNAAQVGDALEVIAGTGVIRQLKGEEDCYTLGSRLFEEWVVQEDFMKD